LKISLAEKSIKVPEAQTKFTILAVDDTPENLDVVRGILASQYTVKAAINGPMALKIVEKQPPDLILLDIMMPEMNGYEVCKRLKSNPETKHIPVIFLTAMDQTTDESSGFELGAADYITKPVNPPILEARVKTHLALKQSMDELQKAYGVIKRQKDRMEDELNIGHDIQMSMLPLVFPPYPDRNEFSINALLEPAREVGGDFYDFFFIGKDELCLVIGDVSGKGVPGALFMAVTRTMIKSSALGDRSPASIVTRVNEELSADNPQCMFVTLFLGIVNVRTGEFRFTNAGHNPPYIIQDGGELVCLDHRHGPIIGAVEGIAYKENVLSFSRNDRLLLFTDGVTEAMNPAGDLYLENRLEEFLNKHQTLPTDDLVTEVLGAVEEFAADAEQADDITLLAFSFDIEPQEIVHHRLELEARADLSEISRVNQELSVFAGEHGLGEAAVQKVSIALDDLLNNIISYGFDDEEDHIIQIKLDYAEGRLEITISDDGVPFNPFDQAQPDTALSVEDRKIGGLGVLLVKELMSDVHYQRQQDSNVVTLTLNTVT
jgi:sigma-B regulation protein RsbU (phosphoserine phosphatase)